MAEPSDHKRGAHKGKIGYTRLYAELPHAVFAGERIGQQTGGKGYQQPAADAEQTADHDQVDHIPGEEVEDAARQIDGEGNHYYPYLAF